MSTAHATLLAVTPATNAPVAAKTVSGVASGGLVFTSLLATQTRVGQTLQKPVALKSSLTVITPLGAAPLGNRKPIVASVLDAGERPQLATVPAKDAATAPAEDAATVPAAAPVSVAGGSQVVPVTKLAASAEDPRIIVKPASTLSARGTAKPAVRALAHADAGPAMPAMPAMAVSPPRSALPIAVPVSEPLDGSTAGVTTATHGDQAQTISDQDGTPDGPKATPADGTAPAIPTPQSQAPDAASQFTPPDKHAVEGADTGAASASATVSPTASAPLPDSSAVGMVSPPPVAPTPASQAGAAPATTSQQVAHAVAAVHVAPGGQGQVTIHLNPGELGTVEVKIARAPDGTATVTVQVEKAETLQTMQLDIAHLHQALDRAGVPAEQREVTMHLVPAAATSSFSADAGTSGGSNNGGFGAGTAGGQGQRGGQQQQQGHGSNGALLTPHTPEHADTPRWQAAGINITA